MKTDSYRNEKRFLAVFTGTLVLVLGVALAVSLTVLNMTGELLSVDDVVSRQQRKLAAGRICLYDSALGHTTSYYKLSLYDEVRPDVLVLGSSRMMQVRPELFRGRMVNAGGAMSSASDGYHFLRMALTRHKPKFVLIGLDFWAFNSAFQLAEPLDLVPEALRRPVVKIDNLLLPFLWIWKGQVDVSRLGDYAANCHMGAPASSRMDGFGPSGEYYYTSLAQGRTPSQDEEFKDTLSRIARGDNRFQYGASPSQEHLDQLARLAELLDAAGVPHAFVMPPLALPVYQALRARKDDYAYVWELEKHLARQYGAFVFHDRRTISSTDCEFVDGFHGGDVIYARLVAAVGEARPDFGRFLNWQEIKRFSVREGITYGGSAEIARNQTETDFLRLGCAKTPFPPQER